MAELSEAQDQAFAAIYKLGWDQSELGVDTEHHGIAELRRQAGVPPALKLDIGRVVRAYRMGREDELDDHRANARIVYR